MKLITRLTNFEAKQCDTAVIGWGFVPARDYDREQPVYGHLLVLSVNLKAVWLYFKLYIKL